MDYVVSTFKSMGENPCEPYYEKIARVQVRGDVKSITGKVISISDRYITLEHLDKRTTLIRIEDISVISAVSPKAAI